MILFIWEDGSIYSWLGVSLETGLMTGLFTVIMSVLVEDQFKSSFFSIV